KPLRYTLALISALMINTSCLDEPLENERLAGDTDYTQSENMVLLLYGAYAELNSLQWETFPLIAVRGDDVDPAGDQVPLIDTDEFKYDRNFWIYNSTWLNLYSDLIYWHGAMEEIKKYQDAGANEDFAQKYIAEIKVFGGFKIVSIS